MTMLAQAETIRDETAGGANTATRVGSLLVEMVDAINTGGGSAINSAGFYSAGGVLNTDGDFHPVPMEEGNAGFVAYKTGTGISVTYGNGCYYFSGLSANKVYQVSYTFRMASEEVSPSVIRIMADSFSLAYGNLFIDENSPVSGEYKAASFTGMFSGLTECALIASTSAQAAIDDINASIIDLGLAV